MNNYKGIKINVYNFLICYLLVWVVFQDFFISIFYNITGLEFVSKLLLYSKDIIMIILFLDASLKILLNKTKIRKFKTIVIFSYSYLLFVGIYVLITLFNMNISFLSLFATLRGIILLPVFIIISLGVDDYNDLLKFFTSKYFIFLIIIAAIGVVDFYFSSKDFWRDVIGIGKYTTDIKQQGNRLVEGLPGNFYGDYGKGYFIQKRLVSVWAVPLTAAYVLCIPFIYYLMSIKEFSRKYIKEIIYCLFLFFSIYLTHTRAIILPCIAIVLCFIAYRFRKYGYKFFVPLGGIILVFIMIFWQSIYLKIFDGSTHGHINSLITSMKQINLLGSGIGTFGVWSNISTENSYFTIMGQIGIIGLILYLSIWIITIKNIIFKIINTKKISNLEITVIVLSLIYSLTGVISEQIFAFTTIIPYYLLLGIINNKCLMEE